MFGLLVYRIFLMTIKPTMAIARMMAIVEAAKYNSVGGNAATGLADGVGAAASTVNAVTACDE